jgi:osmotically-inducible protein OsmY
MNPGIRGARGIIGVFALVMMLLAGGCASSGTEPSRTAGQITDDIAIETSVRSRLIADSSVASWRIEIAVFQRTVTLFGRVPDEATRIRVLDIARQVRGVAAVDDRLTIVAE